jgi:hypothetical protein
MSYGAPIPFEANQRQCAVCGASLVYGVDPVIYVRDRWGHDTDNCGDRECMAKAFSVVMEELFDALDGILPDALSDETWMTERGATAIRAATETVE